MKIDKKGSFHTLEEDLIMAFKRHGIEILSENVHTPTKFKQEITIWTIYGRNIKEKGK